MREEGEVEMEERSWEPPRDALRVPGDEKRPRLLQGSGRYNATRLFPSGYIKLRENNPNGKEGIEKCVQRI